MIGFLRCLGVLNAGVWFGAAVFFTFAIGPSVFSAEMRTLLQNYYQAYSGLIAQIFIARYFKVQLICSILALAHLIGENLYFGRAPQKTWFSLLATLFVIALLGGCWLQPKMKDLHETMYSTKATVEQRQIAAQSFKGWHGFSQAFNLLVIAGVGLHLCWVAKREEETRCGGLGKFRS